jgi:gliding motility-associated-like protein
MDNKGCTSTTSLQITIKTQTPTIDFSYASPVCQNGADIDTITVAGFNTGGFFSSPDLQVDPLSGQIHLGATPSGSYYVTYSLAANGCTAAALNSATLEILPGAPLAITPGIAISPGATIALQVSGGTSYTWDPSPYLSCLDCDNPYASPPENTKFCVSSQLGSCIANTCVLIVVTCETNADYSLPNAFTPNGDANNDAYCLKGWNFCITEFNVRIFDRWGELVFESSEADFCWDGIYKGLPLPIDVYYYVVNAKKSNGTIINRKGDISLLR